MRLASASRWFLIGIGALIALNLGFLGAITGASATLRAASDRQQSADQVLTTLTQENHLLNQAVLGYLKTGQTHHLDVYFAVIEVRRGERAPPATDDPVSYWNRLLAEGRSPDDRAGATNTANPTQNFVARLEGMAFRPGEIKAAQTLIEQSEALHAEETIAFAIAQGLFDRRTNQFASDGAAPDPAAALSRLYEPHYQALRWRVTESTRLFARAVRERVNDDVIQAERKVQRISLVAQLVNVLLIPVLAGAALMIRRRVIQPVAAIAQQADRHLRGDYTLSRSRPVRAVQEVEVMAHALDALAQGIKSELARRDLVEKDLAHARDGAEVAARAKAAFLANMSHEIRTPLNAVIGMTNLALETPLDAQQRDYLTKVSGASEHLLGVINDILDFSKIEAGAITLETSPFTLDEVVGRALGLVRQQAHAKELELVCSYGDAVLAEPLQVFAGDALRIGQVLANLLSNAVKFTAQGTVRLEVDLEPRPAEGDPREEVVFRLRDTGIGMTPDQIGRLFNEFVQADTSTTRRFGGTGLGLTISKKLVVLMGGRIDVNSSFGQGSTFTVHLPLQRRPNRRQQVLDGLPQRPRVLVAVEASQTADSLARMVSALCPGAYVEHHRLARAAIDALLTAEKTGLPFDWLMLAEQLPDHAAEVVQRVANCLTHSPQVIMLSARLTASQRQVAQALGCWRFLDLPVLPTSLLDLWAPRAAQAAGNGQEISVAGLRVLLVEDNALNRQLALDVLGKRQVQAEVATNGREALDILLARGPTAFDVVLMDIQMPVMDGIEATRTLRRDAAFDALPIVAMTANVMPEEQEQCRAAGMQAHVSKPFRTADLVATLRRAVDRSEWLARPESAPARRAPPDTPSVTPPASSPFSFDVLLKNCADDRDLADELVRSFLAHHGGGTAAWAADLEHGEFGVLHRNAHTLKGLAATFGAMDLREACLALEKAAKAQDASACHTQLPTVAHALAQVLSAMRNMSPEAPSAALSS